MIPDHYQALGVQPDAGPDEIRAAYRRLMRTHHPDVRPGDGRSEELARTANEAWAVLRDQQRRTSYDRLRSGSYPAAPDRVRRVAPPDGPPAYSPEGARYRRSFSGAIYRVAAAAFALGVVALGALGR